MTFAYDASGQRIQKTQGANTTLYFGLSEQVNGAMVQYYYAGPILVAKKQGGAQTWYHADRLGSIRLMTNDRGQEVKDYDYQAFGSTQSQSGTEYNERGFNGHISDAETGLIYMGARYYDAQLGRFLSADTIVASLANPQSLNRYSYVYNNPINNTDPTGHRAVNCEYDGEGGRCGSAPSPQPTGTNPKDPGANGSNPPAAGATSADDTGGDGGKKQTDPSSDSKSQPNSIVNAVKDLLPLAKALDETTDHCGICKYPIRWDKLSEEQRRALRNFTNETEGSWNDNSVAVDVAGTLADPAMLIPIGGGGKIVYNLADAAITKIGTLLAPPATALTVKIIERSGGIIFQNEGDVNIGGDVAGRDIIKTIINNYTFYGPYTPEQWKDIMDRLGK